MGYRAENWSVGVKQLNKLVSTERKILRMICGVTLSYRIKRSEVTERMGVDSIEVRLRRQRLRWFGHVLRRGRIQKWIEY